MLVINKKRIKFITLILIFSISIYLIDGMTIKEKETVEVTSTPTSNKVIIVDSIDEMIQIGYDTVMANKEKIIKMLSLNPKKIGKYFAKDEKE